MSATAPLPWYRHFWPWFVLGLLGTSVTMSLTTVYIAVSGRDPEVHDTWSSDAKAVTRDDAPERLARELGLSATVVTAEGATEGADVLRVTLHGTRGVAPSQIVVRLVHPTLERRDVAVTLGRTANGTYAGSIPPALEGRFHLAIEGRSSGVTGGAPAPWQLGDRIDLLRGRPIEIGTASGSGTGEG